MKNILVIMTIFFLSGCVGTLGSREWHNNFAYSPPKHKSGNINHSKIINKPFDEVWKNLIQYSAKTFFAIENYEKDSGLITLSFGSDNITKYVDGGKWNLSQIFKRTMTTPGLFYPENPPSFKGTYAEYIAGYNDSSLQGKLNIAVMKIDENTTEIVVNALYILNIRPSRISTLIGSRGQMYGSPTATFSFSSGNCDSIDFSLHYRGDEGEHKGGYIRTICPTYFAEQSIINGVN
jgi:hypothetical protein